MITQNREEWETSVSKDESFDTTHKLIDRFKHFHVGNDVAILVKGEPYTRITRVLHDDIELNVKHINPDRDVLHKICKVHVIKESDPSKKDIGHKIIYFRNVDI